MRRVSIIIPFFNPGPVLEESIRSAIAQTGVDCEIIAIDDGSTDASLAIARRYQSDIRVLTGPNRGVSAARNRGIRETAGDWIVFLDADDLLTAGTLQKRFDALASVAADVVVCDWQEFVVREGTETDTKMRTADMDALAADAEIACATSFWATTAALMYRRELVEKIGGLRSDLPVIQDARFLFDAAHQGARFVHSPHVGARYRVMPESLSRRDPARFWRDSLLNGQQIEVLWRARAPLTSKQRMALCDIYNGVAHGLFRAGDPAFRRALIALRAADLPISRRNRILELMSAVAGQPKAVRLAELWTRQRRTLRRLDRSRLSLQERRTS
ncbi:glycosyltransferase (plasmid) [Bradyrhizobium sp. ISRA443]|uniref:glycosyltransferase family 2 protein n=1 Tax=unclassified Bradyrhizobium TaxID=2631580 RepID=UPI00247A8761|nr:MULTISPECIES: glycosyltransferase [unclassified Bradyrhizobium]WGR90793.1 glycosyltransferase [Bradyrhizobium sp. ISRA435]WGS03075.1 glycosyltransferase [Bradyrhizobium sp. ISRA436]WGS09891.1 glycosyltransferase [Bradyrhizobium sp. ISRA437]WGS16776.1 glycosyltransferase [Bradyrhizobium sp. ISRA443]